jgi:hypothetical protein
MAPKTFFDLPAEIRNIIYCLAFQRLTDAIPKFAIPKIAMKRHQAAIKPGQVLRICKTFNIEAAPFIYGSWKFAFRLISNAVRFLVSIGKSYSALLTSIDLGSFSYTDHETRALQWTFQCDIEYVPSAIIRFLVQNCPQLRSIKFWGSRDPYDWLERSITRVEGFETLVNAFPQLSITSYRYNVMLLTVPEVPVPEKVNLVSKRDLAGA